MDFSLESEQWQTEPTVRGCVISQAKIANHFYKYISLEKKNCGIIRAIFPPRLKHPVITPLQIKTKFFTSLSFSIVVRISLKSLFTLFLLFQTMYFVIIVCEPHEVQSYLCSFQTVARVDALPGSTFNFHVKGTFVLNFTNAHIHPPSLIFTGGKFISTGGTECSGLVAGSVNTADAVWEIVSFTHD